MEETGTLTITTQVEIPSGAYRRRGREVVLLKVWDCTRAKAKTLCKEFASMNHEVFSVLHLSASWHVSPTDLTESLR
jgi:hypothetical protein